MASEERSTTDGSWPRNSPISGDNSDIDLSANSDKHSTMVTLPLTLLRSTERSLSRFTAPVVKDRFETTLERAGASTTRK